MTQPHCGTGRSTREGPDRCPACSTAGHHPAPAPGEHGGLKGGPKTAAPVVIRDYDPSWPGVFEMIRGGLAAALGELALAIEHVGSTAIPGCSAKPVIDLVVVVKDRDAVGRAIEGLESIDYRHKGDGGIPGREALTPPPGWPSHHPYVCARDNRELGRQIAFRDYLRKHPDAVSEYSDLKKRLARKYRHDRPAYTEAKTGFVTAVLERAGIPD